MPKKRSPGEGGLYHIPSRNLWRGVIDVGFGPDGRRKQKVVTHRTQAGARAKLKKLQKDLEEHGTVIDTNTTVAQWSATWLTTVCRPKLKPNALAAYESVTRNWIVPVLGPKKVAALKPSDVRLVTAAITKAGRSSSTALKAFNILSGMLESARREGLATRNVCLDVDAPTAAVSTRGSLEPDDALAILRTAAEDPDGTRWWTAILEGLRQSERLGARIDSLDLDRRVLRVEWQLDEIPSEHGCGEAIAGAWPCGKKRGASCPESRLKIPDGFEHVVLAGRLCLIRPKSGKPREVPLVPQLADALARYLEATDHLPNPHGLIWRNADGSPILPGQDGEAWRELLVRAGVIDATTTNAPTTHWARHTTATVLMELGVDPKIIGEIVGHGSERITRRYQHVSSQVAHEAMDRIGGHFAAALTS